MTKPMRVSEVLNQMRSGPGGKQCIVSIALISSIESRGRTVVALVLQGENAFRGVLERNEQYCLFEVRRSVLEANTAVSINNRIDVLLALGASAPQGFSYQQTKLHEDAVAWLGGWDWHKEST